MVSGAHDSLPRIQRTSIHRTIVSIAIAACPDCLVSRWVCCSWHDLLLILAFRVTSGIILAITAIYAYNWGVITQERNGYAALPASCFVQLRQVNDLP